MYHALHSRAAFLLFVCVCVAVAVVVLGCKHATPNYPTDPVTCARVHVCCALIHTVGSLRAVTVCEQAQGGWEVASCYAAAGRAVEHCRTRRTVRTVARATVSTVTPYEYLVVQVSTINKQPMVSLGNLSNVCINSSQVFKM